MAILQTARNQVFDGAGNLLEETLVEVDVTAEVVTYDLHDRVRTALASNAAFLANASPTAGETLTQVRRLTRQVNALVRLLVGDDLLVESSDV